MNALTVCKDSYEIVKSLPMYAVAVLKVLLSMADKVTRIPTLIGEINLAMNDPEKRSRLNAQLKELLQEIYEASEAVHWDVSNPEKFKVLQTVGDAFMIILTFRELAGNALATIIHDHIEFVEEFGNMTASEAELKARRLETMTTLLTR